MRDEAIPALSTLMGGYFHQDWTEDADDVWVPLRSFLAGSSAERVRQLAIDAESVLAAVKDDDHVLERLRGVNGSVIASDFPEGAAAWLQEVGRLARAASAIENGA